MRFAVLAVALGLFATAALLQAAPLTKPVVLKAGKVHEKCFALSPPQKIEYQFTSSGKIDFNIHFSTFDQAYYPVKLDHTNAESGLYAARTQETYCLMWENKTGADVELTYYAKIGK